MNSHMSYSVIYNKPVPPFVQGSSCQTPFESAFSAMYNLYIPTSSALRLDFDLSVQANKKSGMINKINILILCRNVATSSAFVIYAILINLIFNCTYYHRYSASCKICKVSSSSLP